MKNIMLVLFIVSFFAHCANKENNNENHVNTKVSKTISKNSAEDAIIFQRVAEPKENAFTLLVPKDWQIEGGIIRVDPTRQGGPSQSISAKLDFSLKKDKAGTVMIRWLPDVLYFDARNSPAGQMGLFPQGSNYQGMTVLNIRSAEQFIKEIAFPYAHPNALNIKVIETIPLTDVANNYSHRVKQAMPYTTMSYDAAIIKFNYTEHNVEFEEKMICIIENWGQLGAGMWGNKETFFIRTPMGEIEEWLPILSIIQNSVKINLQWLAGEIKGQSVRGEIVAKTQKEIEKLGREISAHKQKTTREINNDMFLTLTEQEEYVNPYTNEIEVGSNQWQHRWINESGDVIYTNNEDYNPNIDIELNRSDYKKSKVRKRFPK